MRNSRLLEPASGVDLAGCLARYGTPSQVPGLEKDDFDLARYEEVIAATRPEVLVECGTNTGASAAWFALRVPRVITIDIDATRLLGAPLPPSVTRLIGSSTDVALFRQVSTLTWGLRTMVSLDSDHSAAHVLDEIGLYAELVTPGCYLVVEDAILAWRDNTGYQGNPLQAISMAMPYREDFERATGVEGRFPLTGSPAGWWRRVAGAGEAGI